MNPIVWTLIETVGSLLAAACVLRAYAWRVHLNPNNPISQFVAALTDWLVRPIGRLVKPSRAMDWPSLIGGVLVAVLVALLFYLLNGLAPNPGRVLLLGLIWLIRWSLWLMVGILILMAVISLINPYAPLAPALNQLSDPILAPIRRIVPLVGGFDLSPLIAILLIQVLLAIVHPGLLPTLLGAAR
ncbi:MAG: YggT family protein [Lautropia sp.]